MIRTKRRRPRLLLWILAVLIVIAGILTFTLYRGMSQLSNLTLDAVDLTKVSDGTYQGQYDTLPIKVTVEVTVVGHKLTDIKILRHFNGQGKPAEAITGRVIEAQSLAVDTVAGATSSSRVILKAIEVALERGIK
jgi:uncharacterized protein with FMN-binding domain